MKRSKVWREYLQKNTKDFELDGRTPVLRKEGKRKVAATKQKIRDAVATLRNEGKTVTRYSVAKLCGSGWQTIDRYKEVLKEGEQLNLLDDIEE